MKKYGTFSEVEIRDNIVRHKVEAKDMGKEALLFCHENSSSPHFPVMRTVEEEDEYTVYEMERLYPASGETLALAQKIAEAWDEAYQKHADSDEPAWRAAEWLAEHGDLPESIKKAIEDIAYWAMNYGLQIELNQRDMMQRADGTLVFIDPFFSRKLLAKKWSRK